MRRNDGAASFPRRIATGSGLSSSWRSWSRGAAPKSPSPSTRPLGFSTTRGHDRDRILVLVTDGQVGNEDQVLECARVRV